MSKSVQSLRALIVDDDRVALSVVSSVVRSIGVGKTLQAVNGHEAFEMFQASVPSVDFIICDWDMPRMSGIELLKKLREGGHQTPFLMLTGHVDSEKVSEAKQSGVSGYIAKPFTPAQIERKVRLLLQPLGV
jgi:CheY-like chemotaxis protein